jgi:hypothetical protein
MKSSICPSFLGQCSNSNLDIKMEVHKRLKTLTLIYKIFDECNFIRGGIAYLRDFGEASTPSL